MNHIATSHLAMFSSPKGLSFKPRIFSPQV